LRVPLARSVLLGGAPLEALVERIVATASAANMKLRVLTQPAQAEHAASWRAAGAASVEHTGSALDELAAAQTATEHTGSHGSFLLVGAELRARFAPSVSVFVGRTPVGNEPWDIVVVEPSAALGVALGSALASKL
jgi:hypothetical protein